MEVAISSKYDLEFPVLSRPNPHVFLQHALCVFYFHISRTRDINMVLKIGKYLEMLIEYIRDHMKERDHFEFLFYLASLYKMIGQTRDIIHGKGERDFSYMMICVFFKFYPELGSSAIRLLLNSDYGCWSDFKYFCQFVLDHYPLCADLICVAIDVAIYQFDKDRFSWDNAISKYLRNVYGEPRKKFVRPEGRLYMSMIAKWMPREKSRFHWLYQRVVSKWISNHAPFMFENIRDTDHYEKIMRKCKMDFRRILSSMNRELDTFQIKQCGKRMNDVYMEKVPLHCLLKGMNGFHNEYLGGEQGLDAENEFKNFLFFGEPHYKNNVHNYKTTQLSVGYFVKQARHLLKQVCTETVICQMHFLNRAWRDNVRKFSKYKGPHGSHGPCDNMLPIVDISFDLDMDAQNNSIGMGILIAQLSPIHRIICSEHNMITLDITCDENGNNGCEGKSRMEFVEIVQQIIDTMNNVMLFELDNTMKTLGAAKYLFKEPTYLIILSSNTHLYDFLNSQDNCFEICQTIFWNVGTCTFDYEMIEFETVHNVLYLSGTSPTLIHQLQQDAFRSWRHKNQYTMVNEIVNHSKYDDFGKTIYDFFL